MKLLKGIYPPLTTPFRNDKLSYNDLKSNLIEYNKFDLAGYVVGGSNGEAVFLTKDEKIKLFSSVREHAASDKQVIAGTGSESIKETIELTNLAASVGADFALIITPHFFKNEMTHNAFVNYYRAIADNIKIPLIVYNVTKFTGVYIHPETIAELSNHSNIVGLKNSSTKVEDLKKTIELVNSDFAVLAGTGSVLFPALAAGAKGGILALANIAPQECINIFKYFNGNKPKEAEKIQRKLIELNQAITARYGVAGLKFALDCLGLYGGNPRIPLNPLSEEAKRDLISILKNASLLTI